MKRRIMSSADNFTVMKSHEVVLVENTPEPMGYTLLNPYAVNKNSSLDLVELAKEIQTADSFVEATTCSKLKIIAEQIKFLKQQAESVLLEARRNSALHHVACNFKKVPGKSYHLYQRSTGQKYFSILSPEEWGSSIPHKYLGSYLLQQDMSWTPSESESSDLDSGLFLLKKVLEAGNSSMSNCISTEAMMIDS